MGLRAVARPARFYTKNVLFSRCVSTQEWNSPSQSPLGKRRARPQNQLIPSWGRVETAEDTLGLIDRLLADLPDDEPSTVCFDLDETLITRDTNIITGLRETDTMLEKIRQCLGESTEISTDAERKEVLGKILDLAEKDYESAEAVLVDPLLARVIRSLKLQGHSVYGLTSNILPSAHATRVLQTLSKYKIRFSDPVVLGELPRTGAIIMDHPVVRGVIFKGNTSVPHDKGQIMAEAVSLRLHAEGKKRGTRHTCVLVDNTEQKCLKAVESFSASAHSFALDLRAIHFCEADNTCSVEALYSQFSDILKRLTEQHEISESVQEQLLAEEALHPNFRGKTVRHVVHVEKVPQGL